VLRPVGKLERRLQTRLGLERVLVGRGDLEHPAHQRFVPERPRPTSAFTAASHRQHVRILACRTLHTNYAPS
jgi:hypothetical protein